MAGIFGFFAGGGGDRGSGKPVYSIEYLQQLHSRLQILWADEQNRDQIVEVIRQITEALIWGEQNGHDNNFFDFFCEKSILAEFVRALGLPGGNRTVKVQLLQTLSMLVQNVRRDTSLYYLFSNNYMNQLISTQFDWSDEEILGYYISFVKSLALRLNRETIKFFFNENSQQFPLYVEAVRFFGHRDQMVRTAVRTLTLQVYSIGDEAMRRFLLEQSSRTYFVHLACHMRELWARLHQAAERAAANGCADQALEAHEQQQDLLMYVCDVLSLEVPQLGEALAAPLLHYAIYPVLVGSVLLAAEPGDGDGCAGAAGDAPQHLVSPACALFLLRQVLDTCRGHRAIVGPLAQVLLRAQVTGDELRACLGPPPAPPRTYRATTADVSGPPSSEGAGSGARAPRHHYEAEQAAFTLLAGGLSPTARRRLDPSATSAPQAPSPSEDGQGQFSALRRLRLWLAGAAGDAPALLAAGLLRACLGCRALLPQELLAEAGLAPRCEQHGAAEPPRGPERAAEHPVEVLLLAARALERHASLRVVTVQALAQLALDVVAGLPGGCPRSWGDAPLEAARRAEKLAARQVRGYLQGPLGDGFLDVFVEEWELHRAPPPAALREACGSVRCLLPPPAGGGAGAPAEWALPAAHSERQHAAKAVRCLLVAQRLRHGLVEATLEQESDPEGAGGPRGALPAAPVAVPTASAAEACAPGGDDSCPLHIAEEKADAPVEGLVVELGRQDRLVCELVLPEGRHTRYLVLHKFLLMLVQPDLVAAGSAVVRTSVPVRQVEPHVDRGDPRSLRLGLRLPRSTPCPGEARPYDPSLGEVEPGMRPAPEELRGSSLFTVTLAFEDTRRCRIADEHLRRRRGVARQLLQGRVEAFVEALCS